MIGVLLDRRFTAPLKWFEHLLVLQLLLLLNLAVLSQITCQGVASSKLLSLSGAILKSGKVRSDTRA